MPGVETHLVLSPSARRTLLLETDYSVEQVEALADRVYRSSDIAAAISSGSFRACGMIVAPCSMKTVSGIATSYSDNLLLRAADVILKERRRLLLLVRETPLHLGHLRLLVQVAELGAVVMPPMPAFYHRPETLQEVIDQTVNRALDALDIELGRDLFPRWTGAVRRKPSEDRKHPAMLSARRHQHSARQQFAKPCSREASTRACRVTTPRILNSRRKALMAKSFHKIRVHAAPERVYEAIATEKGLKGWFTPHIEGETAEGHEVTMSFTGKEPFRWKFSHLKPTSHVRWDCLEGPGAAKGTSVTYTLNKDGDSQTLVELDHDGWPEGHAALATCNTLWGVLMGRLKDFSETGEASPAFT